MQDGEPYLAGTAKPAVARLSPATAGEIGAAGTVTVTAGRGAVTLPLEITPDLPDRVVWLPGHSAGCSLYRDLGVPAGSVVEISTGGAS
jgi:NADH-quinone oxidoreductase subunit G